MWRSKANPVLIRQSVLRSPVFVEPIWRSKNIAHTARAQIAEALRLAREWEPKKLISRQSVTAPDAETKLGVNLEADVLGKYVKRYLERILPGSVDHGSR